MDGAASIINMVMHAHPRTQVAGGITRAPERWYRWYRRLQAHLVSFVFCRHIQASTDLKIFVGAHGGLGFGGGTQPP